MATCDPKKITTARFRSNRYVVTAIIAFCALAIGSWFYWRYRVIGTLVPFLATGQYYDGEIILRAKSPNEDVLLIGLGVPASISLVGAEPKPIGKVFRFVPSEGRLELDGLDGWDGWDRATGAITFRYSDRLRTTDPVKRNQETGLLSSGKNPLQISGAYNLEIDVSPDRRFVNVLSANAPQRKGNFMFFLGGGGYPRGPYYHETFDRMTGAKIGPTYTLKDPRKPVNLSYCWEANSKYILYHDMHGRFLWVVPGPNLSRENTGARESPTADSHTEQSHE